MKSWSSSFFQHPLDPEGRALGKVAVSNQSDQLFDETDTGQFSDVSQLLFLRQARFFHTLRPSLTNAAAPICRSWESAQNTLVNSIFWANFTPCDRSIDIISETHKRFRFWLTVSVIVHRATVVPHFKYLPVMVFLWRLLEFIFSNRTYMATGQMGVAKLGGSYKGWYLGTITIKFTMLLLI